MTSRIDRFAPFLLGAIFLLLHGHVIDRPLFADDYLFLDRVRFAGLRETLVMPDALGNFWRPLSRQVYFWAISHGFGESATACHLVNLATALAILVLLFRFILRQAGSRAAWIAVLLVAPLAPWDVPMLWASGTQDLFAILLALVALHLADRGRFAWSALFYGLALLCKEVVVLLPALVVLLAWRRDRPIGAAFRAALPHAAVAIAWAIPWVGRMRASPGAPSLDRLAAVDALAPFVHLPQVLLGIEVGPADALDPRRLAATAACAGLALLALRGTSRPAETRPAGIGPARLGAAWGLAGTIPIVAVAPIWCTYYYLFALCGIGLWFGASLARRPLRLAAAACLVTLAGATFARQRAAVEVPVGAWTWRSHIDAAYVLRSERIAATLLASLRRAVPRPRPGTTFYFSNVPGAIAWQVADGPFVRWAYRDSSLKSYFLSQINEDRVERSPVFLFSVQGDTLVNSGNDPGVTFSTAARAVLQADLGAARGALRYHMGRWPGDAKATYLFAWVAYAQGEQDLSRTLLGMIGMQGHSGAAAPELIARARARLAAADSSGARDDAARAIELDPYDPASHDLFIRAAFRNPRFRTRVLMEGFALIALAPEDPMAWRRWAFLQASFGEMTGTLHSLARYRQLAPRAAETDRGATWLEAEARRREPFVQGGGQLVLQ
jgi:hypothetical protein